MNVLFSWLLTHWRIVGPTVAAVVAFATNVAKPGGVSFLLANWSVILPVAVGLVTWVIHAYKHVQDNTPITEDLPAVVNLPVPLVTTVTSESKTNG